MGTMQDNGVIQDNGVMQDQILSFEILNQAMCLTQKN